MNMLKSIAAEDPICEYIPVKMKVGINKENDL